MLFEKEAFTRLHNGYDYLILTGLTHTSHISSSWPRYICANTTTCSQWPCIV